MITQAFKSKNASSENDKSREVSKKTMENNSYFEMRSKYREATEDIEMRFKEN